MKAYYKQIILLLILVGSLVYVVTREPTESVPIPSSGGEPLRIVLPTPVHFLQHDARWGNEMVGPTVETLRNIGCTLCSLTMAVNGHGKRITPKGLNDFYNNNDGYTDRSWLKWETVSKLYPDIKVDELHTPKFKAIDEALKAGNYPIIKFFMPNDIPHWVLIVGKDKEEYLILDPLDPVGPKVLSQSTKQIHSLRIVEKN